jgi:HSP20 family protein
VRVKLELWRPLIDLERDWESMFRWPHFIGDKEDFAFRPSMDISRDNGKLVISTELPGIDPEKDIEITVDDDYLTIEGEKSEEKETTDEHRYTKERRYGKFVRRIPVPEGVGAERISADYSKGVLTVTVTLPEETAPPEPKRIPVSASKD